MKIELTEKILEKYLLWEDTKVEKKKNIFEWKYVIIRGYDAWVWAWKLIDWTVWHIVLEDARMLWRRRCKKWIGLSWIASHWLADMDEVKILETQKKVLITDTRVSTFFEVNSEIEKQIREWKVSEQVQ